MNKQSEDRKFFAKQTPSSRVKAEIVSEYFTLWSKKMIQADKNRSEPGGVICYLDLFSGPGKYDDGALSTPLMILEQARSDKDLQHYLQCGFNDADANNIRDLEQNIASMKIPLEQTPEYRCGEVDQELTALLASKKLPPTLMFVDPYGYKGLSLELLEVALKHYGADVIFFLNYNRLSIGINNPKITQYFDAIFGAEGAKVLKAGVDITSDKEELLLNSLFGALKAKKWDYFSVFKFLSDSKDAVSHFLVMVSKHERAFEYMQSIMSKKSSSIDQNGFNSFTFEPKDFQTLLTLESKTIALAEAIQAEYKGKQKTLNQIYREHGVGKPFVRPNYVSAVWHLFDQRQVTFQPKPPRSRTECGDNTIIQFI